MDAWRDLGRMRTADGRAIRPGALFRARSLDDLDEAGWTALREAGVRTVIDLRNDDERAAAPPGSLHLPLDGNEDREFWDEWASDWRFGTPVYYGPHLARFPERSLAVLAAIADAPPGGVLFHCMGGRDRTGMIAMLVLALVGVPHADIAADYELSAGAHPDSAATTAGLERAGTSARAELLRTLHQLELDTLVGAEIRDALRARLLG